MAFVIVAWSAGTRMVLSAWAALAAKEIAANTARERNRTDSKLVIELKTPQAAR
jgi:hypothetical protein